MDRDTLRGALLRLPGLGRLDFALRGYRRYWHDGERELRLLRYLVDPDRAAVDVGANRGYYTFWLMRLARHAYAYEPNPANLRYLRHARGNVTVSDVALSHHEGQATFRVYRRRTGRGGATPDHRTGRIHSESNAEDWAADEYTVPVRRLDDEGLENVGFIKIDVEGHEREVLAGAAGLLARDRPTLLIEIEERHTGRPLAEDIAAVEELGYVAFVLMRRGLCRVRADEPATIPQPGGAEFVNNFIFLPA